MNNFFLFWTMVDIVHNTKVCIRLKIFVQIPFILKIYWNTHSINYTARTVTPAVSAAVPKLLHGPFLSPQTSQIQFSPISRGGINRSVCRSNSLGTLHSTHWPVHASSRNWRKLDLRGLRRMNWTTAALHCTVLHSTIL